MSSMWEIEEEGRAQYEAWRETQEDEELEGVDVEIGTCQRCGRYHDPRFVPICSCGGEVL